MYGIGSSIGKGENEEAPAFSSVGEVELVPMLVGAGNPDAQKFLLKL